MRRTPKKWTDPVTGDEYGLEEHIAWRASSVIRTIWVIIFISLVTLAIMIQGQVWTEPLPVIWNYWASWWALLIESLVGLALFNQTKRDAVILREIRRRHADIETMLDYMRQMMDKERETLIEMAGDIEEIQAEVEDDGDDTETD